PCSAEGDCPGGLRCDSYTHTCVAGDATPACATRSVSAGRSHTCAGDSVGGAWCWGLNDTGQAAPGGPHNAPEPVQIALRSPAAQVAAGRDFSCARLDDGAVWCWGDNSTGALGPNASGPVGGPIEIPIGGQAIELGAGSHHACVRRQVDQAVLCWGLN